MGATTLHSPSPAKPLLRASHHTETHTYKHTYTRKNKEFFVLCLNLWNQVTLVFVTLWPRKEKRGEGSLGKTLSNHPLQPRGWVVVCLSVCVCAVRICWSYNFWHLALFALHNIYEGKFGLPTEHPPLPFRGGEFAHVIFRSLLTFISIYYFMMMYAFLRPQLPISVFFPESVSSSQTRVAETIPAKHPCWTKSEVEGKTQKKTKLEKLHFWSLSATAQMHKHLHTRTSSLAERERESHGKETNFA